jgi:hypothetical protein
VTEGDRTGPDSIETRTWNDETREANGPPATSGGLYSLGMDLFLVHSRFVQERCQMGRWSLRKRRYAWI